MRTKFGTTTSAGTSVAHKRMPLSVSQSTTKIRSSAHSNGSDTETTEVLWDKSAMYIRVTLYWGYLIILWLSHLGISCTVLVLACTVVVLTCFVMCGCECVCMCGCFGNMYTCIYCVLFCLYYVFVLFRLCIFILICFVCTGVRTTATEWQLNCS
jgi:hypothetical protein